MQLYVNQFRKLILLHDRQVRQAKRALGTRPMHDSETWFIFQNMLNYDVGEVKTFFCSIRLQVKYCRGGGSVRPSPQYRIGLKEEPFV